MKEMAASKVNDDTIPNGSINECGKENSDCDSTNNPDENSGSDGDSDSTTPSMFSKFYEAKAKGIYDTRNQDVVTFIMDTITLDSKKDDRNVLMNAYAYLQDSRILDGDNNISSVNWTSTDANSRRVMHKLCEFYGLNHNIRGANEPNSMTIEKKMDKFRAWDFSLHELATHLLEKQNQQTKTILKRTVDVKAAAKSSGASKDTQTQSLQSYDERQKNYNAVKQKLGITSDDGPSNNVMGRTQVIRRNYRFTSPEDINNYRKPVMKPIPNVPPLMGAVYEPMHPNRTFPQYLVNPQTVPLQQQCLVLRRVPIEHLSPSDMHNAYVFREGRWHELVNCNPNGDPVFLPCDEISSLFLNGRSIGTELAAAAYHAISTTDIHLNDSDSYNGNPKVITSPVLSSGMPAHMISSMNGSFSTFPPQTFNQSTPPGVPVSGQSHATVGGSFVANSPYFHPSGAPPQTPQHPPQSITPQEHMRPSMNMPQMNQTPVPPSGDPSAPLTNGHVVLTTPPQQIALPDLGNKGTAVSGPSGGQPHQGIILGIPTGQHHHGVCPGGPPPPMTVGPWSVGANGPPPSAFASTTQYVTQTSPAVGHVIRPGIQAVASSAPNFFNPVPHKIPTSSVIQQASAGSQGIGFPGVQNVAHHPQNAPHRAFMGQPLMQVNMTSNVPISSYNHRGGRRGPLSRQNSHNSSSVNDGTNTNSGAGGTSAPGSSH